MKMLGFCFYFCISVNLYLCANCFTPEEQLCANPECTAPISIAEGTVSYSADSASRLSFKQGKKITIISKPKNGKGYWGAIIDGKNGYVPSHLIKETKMHCTTDKLIPVLTKPSSDNKTLVQKKNSVVEDGSNINVYEMSSQTYGEVDSVVYHNSNLKANNQDWEKPLKVVDTSHSDKSFVEESDSISNAYNSFLQPKPYSIIERTTVVINTVDEITPSSTADVKIDSQTALPFVSREYTQAENVMDNQNKLKVIKEKNNINKEIFAGEILKTEGVKSSVKNEKPNENIHMFSTKMVGNDHYHYNNDNKVDENIQNYNDNKVNNSNNNDVTKGDNYYSESGGDENHENANDHDGGWNDKGVDIGSDPGKNMLIKKLEQQQQQQQNIMGSSTILPNNFLKGSETVEKVSLLHATTSTNSYSIISGSELLSEQEVGENHIRDSIIINSVDKQVELINEVTTNKKTNDKNLENAILQGDDMPSLPLIPNSLKSTGVHEIQNNFDEKEFVHGTLNELNSVMSNIDFSASVAPQTEQTISEETISNQIESNAQNSYGDFQVTPAFNHKANYIKSVMEIPGDNLHEVIKSDVEVIAETFNELPLQHSRSIPDGNESLKPTADVVEQSSNLVEEVKSTLRNNVTPSFVDVSESESTAESFGFFSQVTDTLTIKTGSKKDETNYEEKNEIADARSSNPDVAKVEDDLISNESGSSKNFVEDSEYKELTSDQEYLSWKYWFPYNISGSGNTFLYLVVTAVTVLLFTLGHNFIEKKGKSGRLIAKINKLEQELFVTSKECLLLKDELQNTKEKVALNENSSKDELIDSLQVELEESKKARSELESSVEVLQQELDAATEAGLDLNKMLSEVLTQKGGSESLLKSVENLEAQLNSQQKIIDEMTKELGVKNKENERLQAALETANEKIEYLEDQITDTKTKLDTEKGEKEEITRDLKLQVSELEVRINQLNESKEKEISKIKQKTEILQKKLTDTSDALAVKEEECKRIKVSFKEIKLKGTSNLDSLFDVCRVKAELSKAEENSKVLLEQLEGEKSVKIALEAQVKSLELKVNNLEKNLEEAKKKEDEAINKLEVLSTYFKEKETQLQKELGLQEALWAQKKGDEKTVYNMLKSLQEEVESYKLQNETLKKEILDQERGLKIQIATLEQKAHDNWVAARQAERKLDQSKQEAAQLRNYLTLTEKNSSSEAEGKGNHRAEELNGLEPTSPVHESASPLLFPPLPLDPNSSSLLPHGFMPHPMFMPPPMGGFLPPPPLMPGDRRPPPLGRMSSPPLNSQFSPPPPPDYSFERMSPSLPPHNRNYRSSNEDDKEREHFRHKSPPYPPSHVKNWDDSYETPGFIPISSHRDLKREHKGSKVSSRHSSSDSLDQSSKHSLGV